jgi:hypothetical protein
MAQSEGGHATVMSEQTHANVDDMQKALGAMEKDRRARAVQEAFGAGG